jgi:hypothetical protein
MTLREVREPDECLTTKLSGTEAAQATTARNHHDIVELTY